MNLPGMSDSELKSLLTAARAEVERQAKMATTIVKGRRIRNLNQQEQSRG